MKMREWKDVVKARRDREAELGVNLIRLRRKFLELSQEQVAAKTGMTQSEVSKFEHRGDHLLSTLRKYIQALGGELDIIVELDGKTIRLHGV